MQTGLANIQKEARKRNIKIWGGGDQQDGSMQVVKCRTSMKVPLEPRAVFTFLIRYSL